MEQVKPFHCGSDFAGWRWRNCDPCKKAESCEIQDALWSAYQGSGRVSLEIWGRMGEGSSDCPERMVEVAND